MAPCNPNDLTITEPSGPSPLPISGFGTPFAPLSDLNIPLPEGFPEDLLEILNLLEMILPPGIIKPQLSINFGKDIFDGIMKLLDQFMPFLMLYKFFLPILELIICIIEVLCAIPNPFKLIRALKKLFRKCLPNFLSLFPYFALILMIISLLLLILALVEYIIAQILKLIQLLLKNINALVKAFARADGPSIFAIVKKLGIVLCMFQNFFVLLAIFTAIIDLIRDMLKLFFPIPPCADGDSADPNNCCTTDVCPDFIKNNEELIRTTGSFQYLNQVSVDSGLVLPPGFGSFTSDLRKESWQFYDDGAIIRQALINITSAYDLPPDVNQIFFPTDATYNAATPPEQAPYTVDLRFYYDPVVYGRTDPLGARNIRIKNCIVTKAPTTNLSIYDNSTIPITNGVVILAGGTVYEDDGTTIITISSVNGTLENFIHLPITMGTTLLNDTISYYGFIEYTFKINHEVLLGKALITLGCIPTVALDRVFIQAIVAGPAEANFAQLGNLINGPGFPDPGATQAALTVALNNLRGNMSTAGVATFEAQTTVILNKLKDDTTSSLNDLIDIGFDPNASVFEINPSIQFTSQVIKVKVALNEKGGQPITSKLPASLASAVAGKIKPVIDFGDVSPFIYDGSQFFIADLTSKVSGSGTMKMTFNNNFFTIIDTPEDLTLPQTVSDRVLNYTFIYSPTAVDGKPSRDEGDVSREAASDSSEG